MNCERRDTRGQWPPRTIWIFFKRRTVLSVKIRAMSVISGEVLFLAFANMGGRWQGPHHLRSCKKQSHRFISENPCDQWSGFLDLHLAIFGNFVGFWQSPLFLPQKPDPSIQCAMVRAKECQERRRIYVVINHGGILPIEDVVHANARRPAISVKREFPFHRSVHGNKIGEAELSRA
jgi:hypothetical protein